MPEDTEFTLRPYDRADTARVVELINLASARALGIRRAVVDGAGNVRLSRYVPVTSEKVVAVDARNVPVGYGYLTSSERSIIHETGGAVHPDLWGRGIGTRLAGWAIERATELAAYAPTGVKAVLQTNLFAAEQEAIGLFTGLGFAPVREWVHMAVDLDVPPPIPEAPHGLLIIPMDLDDDWDRVSPVMDAAFADHWAAIALPADAADDDRDDDLSAEEAVPVDESYSNAPGVCFIALDGETVVGGILCNAKLVERDDTGRIGSVFVRPDYRRRGLGQALVRTALHAFRQRGFRRVILDTDARSFTAAPRLYEQAGMRAYRREWQYERTVRAGEEARRLEACHRTTT